MSKADVCNIIPQTRNKQGQEIDSPLYLDINEMYEGDRDKAVSLYTKLISDETLNAVKELPEGLANYYPNTDTPTLATLLNVSNAEKTDPQLTADLKNWLQKNTISKVTRARDLADVVAFNDGEWSTRFTCTFDSKGNVYLMENVIPISSPADNIKFSSQLYEDCKGILQSLNMTEDTFDKLMSDTTILRDTSVEYAPENFLDLCLGLYRFANNKLPHLSQVFSKPNIAMASIVKQVMKNSAFYIRLVNNLKKDDYYKTLFDDDEVANIADDELLEEAVSIVLARAIIRDKKNSSSNKAIEKLSNNVLEEFKQKITNNLKIKDSEIKKYLIKANDITSSINDTFLSRHPQFTELNVVNSQVAAFRQAFDKINSLTMKYLDISKHRYNEDAQNVEDFKDDITQMYYHISGINKVISSSSIEESNVMMSNLINTLSNLATDLQKSIQALSWDNSTKVGLLSNNAICGKIRQAIFTIQYIEKVMDALNTLSTFQKINKIQSKIFTDDINDLLKNIGDIIISSKREVTKISKEAVINELEKTFPNTTFTLPDGRKVTIREFVESDSAVFDIMTSVERFAVSVSECSNPILTLLDSYKKRAVEEGKQVVQEIEHNIITASEELRKKSGKDTSWMYLRKEELIRDDEGNVIYDEQGNPLKRTLSNIPSGKYIMDYDFNKFARDYREAVRDIKRREDLTTEEKINLLEEWQDSHTEIRNDLDGKRHPRVDMYANEDFNKLSPEQKNYWKVFMHEKAKLIDYFPERNYGLDDVIFIRKRNKDLAWKGIVPQPKGIARIFKDRWKSYTSRDLEFGSDVSVVDFANEAIYDLPMFYNYLQEGETMDDISTDTTSSLLAYAEVMMNAASLKNVVNILECASNVIANMNYTDRGTHGIKQLVHRVGKYKDSEDYRKAASKLNSLKMYKEWLTMQVYGQRVNKQFRKVRLIAGDIMKYINFGTLALNTLSPIANLIQGLNQQLPTAAGGYFFNFKDLMKANLVYDKYMFKPGKDCGLLETGALKHNNKLILIARKFNFMQDISYNNIQYKDNRIARLIDSDTLYFLMHAGEHYLASTGGLALIFNKKNALTTAEGNKINAFDAYDVVDLGSGGSKLVLQKGLKAKVNNEVKTIVTNEELAERAAAQNKKRNDKTLLKKDEISEGEWLSSLKQKISGMNNYMHGIYNKEDQMRAQYYALGRAAIMYRKYLIPSLQRRFGVKTYIAGLDTEIEGFYTTFFKFHGRIVKELLTDRTKNYDALTVEEKEIVDDFFSREGVSIEDIPETWNSFTGASGKRTRMNILYGTTNLWTAVKNSLTEFQKSNLKTAWTEIGIFFTLVVANVMLDYDDDDDDNVVMAAIKYFLRRAQTEVGALNPLSLLLWPCTLVDKKENPELYALGKQNMFAEFWQLFQQPVAGMNHIEDAGNVFKLFRFDLLGEEAYYNKKQFPNEYSRQFYKLMTPYRHWNDWTVETLHRKENWYKQ